MSRAHAHQGPTVISPPDPCTIGGYGLGTGAGSIALSWGDWPGLWHGASSEGLLIWQLRVPRLLAAACCGALLALAGALMQLLLRNPLADPAVLGISAGASFLL